MGKRTTREDAIDKLWDCSEIVGECLIWNGHRTKAGYPVISYEGNTVYAHRFAYEFYNGQFDADLHICHSCDNPSCISRTHLFAGTPVDNVRDMDSKGRRVNACLNGEKIGTSILTELDVMSIRGHVLGGMSYRGVAKMMGLPTSTIYYAVKYGWKHVGLCV